MTKLYLIGNAHIDPVWLWRWQDGLAEILATFRSALDRMKEFPDFKFTSACAAYYQFVEKLDPDMFAEIQERVREGRWSIVGGWFIQPDCNLPNGESFARHALISQRYFREKFGVTAITGYNVDSFGHNAALPKILKESGIDQYVFMRPSPDEQECSEYVFNWQSDDGSTVTAYRIPHSYSCTSVEALNGIKELADVQGRDMMAFYGVGNHGGGPTVELISDILQRLPSDLLSTPDEYFAQLDRSKLPTLLGELQHHARGCYSAVSEVKRANRKCEQNLLAAERLCVMACRLTGYKYPHKRLTHAWKNLLFNQFHDILGGCSVKSAYTDAGFLFGEIMSITEQEMTFAMQSIALSVDTLRGVALPSPARIQKNKRTWEHETLGIPVIVFNPQTWCVRACVSVNEVAKKVTDAAGADIPFQLVRGEQTNHDGDIYQTAFMAEIPPLGYATYRIHTMAEGVPEIGTMSVSEYRMENSRLAVEFDPETGDVRTLYDKQSGAYVINSPCRAILLDESACDTWAHNKQSLGEMADVFSGATFEIMEKGPVRAMIRSTVGCGGSTVTRDFMLHADSDVLEVRSRIDFHEKHRTLKFTFPLTNESITAEIPYGKLERQGYTGEEPCGQFFVSGALAVANDSKYGYDTAQQEVRLTVLRSAVYADHYGNREYPCEYMDQGISEFSYALFAHRSITETQKKASELNFAPRVMMGGFHGGKLPEVMGCFESDTDTLLFSAIKRAEDSDKTVIRCFDAEGNGISAHIRLFDKTLDISIPSYAVRTFTDSGEALDMTEFPRNHSARSVH